jgi:hydrogenase expression/formation protein HypE
MSGNDGGVALSCPLPIGSDDTVQMAHGGGGRAMARLIDGVFRRAFADPELDRCHDGAALHLAGSVAFTTDSYVVRPMFFPGGDIGALAVNGTVNDLAMCGARPLYLSASFILEEGLAMEDLRRATASMRDAARAAGVRIVTGDTKVVDRGNADGIFITTSGVGEILAPAPVGPARVRAGDAVILSGDIGRHGIAVMAAREGFGFETVIESDCAPVAAPVVALVEAGIDVHCLRDLTRGGLASALVEISEAARAGIAIREDAIPVRADVEAACEILGLDPLHVANEGRFVAFVPKEQAGRALHILRGFEPSAKAVEIGVVTSTAGPQVLCKGLLGVDRVVDMLSGEQLPRIC